jgi:hypothetical protein
VNARGALLVVIVLLAAAACDPVPDAYVFADFETDADLDLFAWNCHHRYRRSADHVEHGRASLRVDLPPGDFPGIDFTRVPRDWSVFDELRFAVYVDGDRELSAMLRIDDNHACTEFEDRANLAVRLVPGENRVTIPIPAIEKNPAVRRLNVRYIRHIIFFLPDSARREVLYLDDFRLVRTGRGAGR